MLLALRAGDAGLDRSDDRQECHTPVTCRDRVSQTCQKNRLPVLIFAKPVLVAGRADQLAVRERVPSGMRREKIIANVLQNGLRHVP
jgi:hypothetical protein